jgi:hypothetical protein
MRQTPTLQGLAAVVFDAGNRVLGMRQSMTHGPLDERPPEWALYLVRDADRRLWWADAVEAGEHIVGRVAGHL